MARSALKLVAGVPKTVTIPSYEATITSTAVTSGTNITLPSSGTYFNTDLKLYLNGVLLPPSDYNYVGSGTRTQFTLNFNLLTTDTLDIRVGD